MEEAKILRLLVTYAKKMCIEVQDQNKLTMLIKDIDETYNSILGYRTNKDKWSQWASKSQIASDYLVNTFG